MYLLMAINAGFLATVASRDMPLSVSVGIPLTLTVVTAWRAVVWSMRRQTEVPIEEIQRRFRGTMGAAAVLSLCYGSWGLLLFSEADPLRASSIALYVFVGAIGACYCLQALPAAARFVLLFGAAPVTGRLLVSGDWYLMGTGLTFILVAAVILRTLATNQSAFSELLRSRAEMSCLLSALTQSEEHYRNSVDLNPQIPWTSDAIGAVCELSPRWAMMTGMPIAEGLGTGWTRAVHPDDLPELLEKWHSALQDHDDEPVADARYRLRQADASYRWVRARSYPRRDTQGRIVMWYGNVEDIDDQVTAEQALRIAAYHDALTGLSNRTGFGNELERALAAAQKHGRQVGIAVVDVDNFKSVNDSLGHAAGDAVLKEVGARVKKALPSGASVSRLGGDEYAIILPDLHEGDDCAAIVGQVLRAVSGAITIEESVVEIGLSAGVAAWPLDGEDPEEVLKSADLALYAVKANRAGAVERFLPQMRHAVETRNTMLREAREALRDHRIVPFYQPKVSICSGGIVGFEALLRWQHRERGLQPPGSIAAAFEDYSLSTQITDRMFDLVLADIVQWRDRGFTPGRIAINGSPADFRRDDFAERILGRLHKLDIAPSVLEVEVTETVLLSQVADTVERAFRALRAEGVTIALDDFGTGHASLSHLQQFPVDVLKIDRSFVAQLDNGEPSNSAIVHGVIDIARRMNIRTVAEGVENDTQLSRLRELGCDIAQGYLFGRAISADRVTQLFRGQPNPGGIPCFRETLEEFSRAAGERHP